MKQIYYFLGIFVALAISRFIPHPPNFTSLIALSFYVPVLFGVRYMPVVLISFGAFTSFSPPLGATIFAQLLSRKKSMSNKKKCLIFIVSTIHRISQKL